MRAWRHTSGRVAGSLARASRRVAVAAGVVSLCASASAQAWSVQAGSVEDQALAGASGPMAAWDGVEAVLVQDVWSDQPSGTVQRGGGPVSLQQATRMALRRYPGRVAGAETVTRNGRQEHRIRILTEDNRVRTVRIDAQTGRFL